MLQKRVAIKAYMFTGIFFLLTLLSACSEASQKSKTDEQYVSKQTSDKINEHQKTILFFGNSITAGYGLDPSEAFPSLIQKKIDSMHLHYKCVNAGVSGETTAGGDARIDWILKQPVDVFVLELGANDGLRGLPVDGTKRNLQVIIDRVKKKYPQAKLVLAGMQIPPSMGEQYSLRFKKLFPELAKENDIVLVPFLLQNVGGIRELNQQDGIHPTAAGARIVAQNVWSVLQPVLQ
ncbi:MAG: arylesterase [Bacteroidota bacterium]|nr:arylesterase [Bacteroidota bacterium]